MLTEGKFIECDVVGTTCDKTGKTLLQVRPSDGSSEEFCVEPLRFFNGLFPQSKAYCKATRDERGEIRLQQDEFFTLNRLYYPNRVYGFKVLKQLTDSQKGKRRYLISAIPGYQHIFTAHRDEVFTVGTVMDMLVTIKAYPDGTACLFYKRVLAEESEFSPRALFERLGHMDDYACFFERVTEQKALLKDKSYLVDDMNKKLRDSNRLWVFDYLSILMTWLFCKEDNSLEDSERGCKLLRDLDIYLLEENGVMMAFTEERREETQKKTESSIERAEALMEACQITREGRADAYLSQILRSLGNTGYLRDREQRLRILRFIDKLDREFMERNIAGFSELLSYVKRWQIASDNIRAIMYRLVYILNSRRKAMSMFMIHHYLQLPDREELTELTQLLGSVMGVLEARIGYTSDCTELQDRRIFGELCSLLSLMTTRERGLRLMNKAVAFLINQSTPAPWDRAELFQAGDNPEPLIEIILNMPIMYAEKPLMTNTTRVLMRYDKGALSLTKVSKETPFNLASQASGSAYQVPETCLQVLSLFGGQQWPENEPLLFYRDRWKRIEESELLSPALSCKTEGVLIRTKQPNPAYKGLIFCSSMDDNYTGDGVIGYKGYAANFRISDLTEIFSPNLFLKADVKKEENGRVLFDITRNLMEFSQRKATLGKTIPAHCLYFNKETGQPFFITMDGVMCRGLSDPDRYYQPNGAYEIEILNRGGEDFPACRVNRVTSTEQEVTHALRAQLIELSEYNKALLTENGKADHPEWCDFPYIHQYMMPYLLLVEGEVALYNTLHLLRLIAIKERSLLNNLFSACIQEMELNASKKAGVPFVTSIKDFQVTDSIAGQFPELRELFEELGNAVDSISDDTMEGLEAAPKDEPSDTLYEGTALNKESIPLMLRFFPDGKYMLGEGPMPGLPFAQVSLQDDGYVVLGYEDGSFKRIHRSRLLGLRKGELLALEEEREIPLKVLYLTDDDSVLIRHYLSSMGHVKIIPVREIPVVSALQDPGKRLVDYATSRRKRIIGVKGYLEMADGLRDSDPDSPGLPESDPKVEATLSELLALLREKEERELLPDDTLLRWVREGAFWRVLYYLDEVNLNIVTRDKLGGQMDWLMHVTESGDRFWPLVEVLIERNPRFYSSIIERVLLEKDPSSLKTEGDGIARAVSCMLRKTGSLSFVMRLLYPLRSLFGEAEKRLVREAKRDFKLPVLYLQLIEMGGLSVDELKSLLVKEDTGAACYAFFEIVRRQYETGAITREEVLSDIALFRGDSVRDGFLRDLLLMGVLKEEPRDFPKEGVDRILRGGFQVFSAASRLEGESLDTFCKGNTRAYLGKSYRLTVDRAYRGYYICWLEKMPVVVPRHWCLHTYAAGQTIPLKIVRGIDRMRLLYAAEKGMNESRLRDSQLLRAGDRVEFQFERIGNKLRPQLRSEFKRLTIIVRDVGKSIVPDYAYTGVVVGQRDETSFYIEMGDRKWVD